MRRQLPAWILWIVLCAACALTSALCWDAYYAQPLRQRMIGLEERIRELTPPLECPVMPIDQDQPAF